VSAARAVPIAAGENAAGLHDFHAQFEAGSIDVAQPSVITIGVPSAACQRDHRARCTVRAAVHRS
jgi:D-galactarolactone cycloisomerase